MKEVGGDDHADVRCTRGTSEYKGRRSECEQLATVELEREVAA